MSDPIHSLGSSLHQNDTNNDTGPAPTIANTTLNNDATIQDLSIRTSQPLPFQFDLSFLHKLDQLLPENPLFFMQQQQQQQQQQQHIQEQAIDHGRTVSENHPIHSLMPSFSQSANNDTESNQSIWSGFNNFFSNVANNPFPQSIPNLAKNVSEYFSNYQLFSSINNSQTAANPQQGASPAPGIKYEALVDGTYKPVDANSPRMQIRVLGVPHSGAKSRVETQIKLCLQLVTDNGDKAQQWTHLKLPDHMVAKDKLKKQHHITLNTDGISGLDDSFTPVKTDTTLFLRARVICASDPSRRVLTCLGCIQRERKRSQRRKETKVKTEHHDGDRRLDEEQSLAADEQRILLFNCSEIVDFTSGDTILPTRITCYCRHHNERLGFCIYFEMQDHTGKPVATGMSPPIMITDDHKSSKLKNGRKRPRTDDVDTPINTQAILAAASSSFSSTSPIGIHPITKNYNTTSTDAASISSSSSSSNASSSSSLSNTHSFSPLHGSFTDSSFSISTYQSTPQYTSTNGRSVETNEPAPASRSAFDKNRAYVALFPLNPPMAAPAPAKVDETTAKPWQQQSLSHGVIVDRPQMQRMIPNEGPTDGGIEVTILGTGFRPGLTCMFGDVAATTTHYWSSNTLVCILPPRMEPGTVAVSFKELPNDDNDPPPPVFTYCNEGDGALMELALQVVGLKMTGKVEDARDIAMRIVDGNGNHVIQANRRHSHTTATTTCLAPSSSVTTPSIQPSLSSTQQQLSLSWRSLPSVEAIRQLLDDRASGQNKLCFDWPRVQMLDSPGPWSD